LSSQRTRSLFTIKLYKIYWILVQVDKIKESKIALESGWHLAYTSP